MSADVSLANVFGNIAADGVFGFKDTTANVLYSNFSSNTGVGISSIRADLTVYNSTFSDNSNSQNARSRSTLVEYPMC